MWAHAQPRSPINLPKGRNRRESEVRQTYNVELLVDGGSDIVVGAAQRGELALTALGDHHPLQVIPVDGLGLLHRLAGLLHCLAAHGGSCRDPSVAESGKNKARGGIAKGMQGNVAVARLAAKRSWRCETTGWTWFASFVLGVDGWILVAARVGEEAGCWGPINQPFFSYFRYGHIVDQCFFKGSKSGNQKYFHLTTFYSKPHSKCTCFQKNCNFSSKFGEWFKNLEARIGEKIGDNSLEYFLKKNP